MNKHERYMICDKHFFYKKKSITQMTEKDWEEKASEEKWREQEEIYQKMCKEADEILKRMREEAEKNT